MSIEEELAKYWEFYEQEMASRDNTDYEIDPEQMGKILNALEFFMETAKKCNGTVKPLKLVPKEVSGGITAYFTLFYLSGDDMARFCKIAESFVSLSIDSMTDGRVCISFTIPGVFRKK